MGPIGIDMANSRYTAKKSAMAAVALFVALPAVPVLANTAQEKVVSRLSTTGVASQNPQRKEAMQPGMPAPLQVTQELEQGTYQERSIRRLSGESPAGVGRKSLQGEEATQSGTPASLQASQEPEQGTYQGRFIRRLAGETLPRPRGPK